MRVSAHQETEKLLIRVSDTGRGIPEEYRESIFQPFFRVDKSRSRDTAAWGWDFRWCGRLSISTAAASG